MTVLFGKRARTLGACAVVAALTAGMVGTIVDVLPAAAGGPPTHITFTSAPTPFLVTAGQDFTVTVAVEDATNAAVAGNTDSIELSFSTFNPGVTINCVGGSPVVAAVNGVATFDCNVDTSGDYFFGASDLTDTGLGTAFSNTALEVTPGAATALAFTVQPQNAATNVALPVEVSAEDQFGNVDYNDSSDAVSLALASGPPSALLSCSSGGTPGNLGTLSFGVIDFTCSIDTPGTGYTISASNSGGTLPAVVSSAFDVGQESATIAVSPDPAVSFNGLGTFSASVVVTDGHGNPVVGDQIELVAGDAGSSTAVTDGSGTATFSMSCSPDESSFSVSATDQTTATIVGSTTEACVDISFPSQDSIGITDSFSLTAAAPDEPVTVSFAADPSASPVSAPLSGSCTTDGNGDLAFGDCNFTVPSVPGVTPPATVTTFVTVGSGPTASTYEFDSFLLYGPVTLQLTPDSGAVGSPFGATATGFTPGELVDLFFGGSFLSTCTADPTGSCSFSGLSVPADPSGMYTVEVDGETSGLFADQIFTVEPSLSLSPATGAPDSTFQATLAGFGANEVVDLAFNGSADGSCTTNSSGSCSVGAVVPGSATPGPSTVTATGAVSGFSASATFSVIGIVLSPTSGPAGTSVDGTAEGFLPGETVNIYYNAVLQTSCSAMTNGDCSAIFTVPALEAHAYTVLAVGQTSGFVGRASFTETASLTLSPSSGPADSTFTANATGFLPGETVDIRVDGSMVTTCAAGPTGGCSAGVAAPAAGPGVYAVVAAGVTSAITADASFTETGPQLSLSPSSGPAGTGVNAAVSNFLSGETVDVSYGGTLVGSCIAGGLGACTASVTVPVDPGGQYSVVAVGTSSGGTADATFTETSTLTATPDSGPGGSTFTAVAGGFAADDTVDVSYGGTAVGSCTADANGACSLSVVVPAGEVGSYPVTTLGSSGLSAATSFNETAELTLVPTSGPVGSVTQATASGFQPAETVNIDFNGVLVRQCLAGTNGSCTAQVTVPDLPAGSYNVSTTGESSGITASASFNVVPALVLTPGTGVPGSPYTATASGFAPDEEVFVDFNSSFAGQCAADASGGCSVSAAVPVLPMGAYDVTALQTTSGLTANATFELIPGLGLSPTSGLAGSTLGVDAQGFPVSKTVFLFYDGLFSGECTTGSNGVCATSFIVPSESPGQYQVLATDGTDAANANFEELPPASLALTPSSGGQGAPFNAEASGFVPGESVSISFDGMADGNCSADGSGACTASSFVPNSLPAGSYNVTAHGSTGDSAAAAFSIEPSLGLVPSSGQAGAPFTVEADGFGAGENVNITFDGIAVGTCHTDTSGDCIANPTVPVGLPGGTYTVTGTGGTSALSANALFTMTVAPSVSSVSPNAGLNTGGTHVTIHGGGFVSPATVRFGGVAASNVTVMNVNTITATSPPGSGSVNVTVTTISGTSALSAADVFTYLTRPMVTGVGPSSGPLSGGTAVTISGSGFASGATVSFGTAAGTVTSLSAGSITATSPAGSGTVDVTVTTPGGTSAPTGADRFTYLPVPTVTGVSPNDGPQGGGTSVTISGNGFAAPATVSFGGTLATGVTVLNSGHITAVSPAGSAGSVNVTVTTPGGTSGTVAADRFTYLSAPTVTGVSPAAGPLAGGTSVVVNGTGFVTGSTVHFGTAAGTVSSVSAGNITVTSPAGSAGTVNITVTTPGGTSGTVAADQFTYLAQPSVSSVSPNAGKLSGGTSVTITGANFALPASVRFGTVSGTITSVSAGSIKATSPPGTAGSVDVTVTTAGGTSTTSPADLFTYLPVPMVTGVSPNSGPLTGGASVVVTGTGFVVGSTVHFGTATGAVTAVSAGSITVTSPAGSAGSVNIAVTTPGGTSPLSTADRYTYLSVPTVTGVTPSSGPVAGGTSVTITGTGFVTGSTVHFGTATGTVTALSAGSITVTSPSGFAGTVNITVTTPGGTSGTVAADRFTYL